MKRYLFTVRILGYGKDVKSAWVDAIESTDLYREPVPDNDDVSELEGEYDDFS